MSRKYTPVAANWMKRQLENAFQESEELGTSVRNLAAKYNIPRATIQRYIQKIDSEKPVTRRQTWKKASPFTGS